MVGALAMVNNARVGAWRGGHHEWARIQDTRWSVSAGSGWTS